jgi:hypothetical protein
MEYKLGRNGVQAPRFIRGEISCVRGALPQAIALAERLAAGYRELRIVLTNYVVGILYYIRWNNSKTRRSIYLLVSALRRASFP